MIKWETLITSWCSSAPSLPIQQTLWTRLPWTSSLGSPQPALCCLLSFPASAIFDRTSTQYYCPPFHLYQLQSSCRSRSPFHRCRLSDQFPKGCPLWFARFLWHRFFQSSPIIRVYYREVILRKRECHLGYKRKRRSIGGKRRNEHAKSLGQKILNAANGLWNS